MSFYLCDAILGDTVDRNLKSPMIEPTLLLYLPNSRFDEALG